MYLDFLARHGVPWGFNRRVGTCPVGQRWRKWSYHYLLLIGQIEKAGVREAANHAEESERRWWGLWAVWGMSPEKDCSVSHHAQYPNSALFLSPLQFSVMTKVFHSTTEMPIQFHKWAKKKANKWTVCVCACVCMKVVRLKKVWFIRGGTSAVLQASVFGPWTID